MFQMIERAGRTAACLNYLVFKGDRVHDLSVPGLLAALPGAPWTESVQGPSVLASGTSSRPRRGSGRKIDKKGGMLHRFGMDDASTGAMLRELMADRALPDFTIAYFADNDYLSHKVGPVAALTAIEQNRSDAGRGVRGRGRHRPSPVRHRRRRHFRPRALRRLAGA